MRIERRNTTSASHLRGTIQIDDIEIRNPMVRSCSGWKTSVPQFWSESPRRAGEVFRKAGVAAPEGRGGDRALLAVRSVPDTEALANSREQARHELRPSRCRRLAGCWTYSWKGAFSSEEDASAFSTNAASCWPSDGRAELAAMVQHGLHWDTA
jgi:hypothetical protein